MRTALLLLLSMMSTDAAAQTDQAAASPPKACSETAHRQFDFWIGKWRVNTPDGKFAGINEISSILGGCVLHENWTGASGMRGQSFNIYDKARNVWHQTWVDTNGTLLLLEGKLIEGRMVMTGERGDLRDRITWTPTGKTLQQVWEQSSDKGRTWKIVFDGRYSRE